jgi:hypothetical protein
MISIGMFEPPSGGFCFIAPLSRACHCCLIHRIREREFGNATDIVFIHTGGSAPLPVYDNVV